MTNWKNEYMDKCTTPETIADQIRSGEQIIASGASSFPTELMNAISARSDLTDLTLHSALLLSPPNFFNPEEMGRIHYNCLFSGPLERAFHKTGIVSASSFHFSQLYRTTSGLKLDTAILEVSKPDERGFMSLGPIGTLMSETLLKSARRIFVQVNPNTPFIYGSGAHIHVSEVEALCEVDRPLYEVPDPSVGEREIPIAHLIADQIPDGATIQLGFGQLAGPIGDFLSDRKELGVHTEMLTTSMIRLYEQGVVTNSRKPIHRDKMIGSFIIGSASDYAFLNRNTAVEFHPASYVNNPCVIAKHPNFISVNSALSVDLTGQVASETLGFSQYSGTGGQLDFVRGARRSEGGKSFIALKSSAMTKGGAISRIASSFAPGTVVTTPRSDVQYIVTEYGIADLSNKSIPERVGAMIGLAHPDFREQLAREALEAGLITANGLRQFTKAA